MKLANMHFAVLLCILAIGVGMFYMTRGSPALQMAVSVTTSVAYILWGIIHHAIRGDLHPKVVVEYILIGGIAIVLMLTMLS